MHFRRLLALVPVALTITIATARADCAISLTQFNQVAQGMSYAAVVRLVGCEGTETSRIELANDVFANFSWEYTGAGGMMTASFHNDRLTSKTHFGLK